MNDKLLTEMLIKAALVILVALIVIVLLVKRFIYFQPSSHFISTQEAYKPVRHGHLHGWLLEANGSNKIILFCHGNGGNISHTENKVVALKNLGYSVLVFDYSGYGKSSGSPSEQQLYDDVSNMTAMLRQQYQPDQIVLYGESLGGPIATYAARRYSIPTLILEAPVPSMKILIQYKYAMLSLISSLFPEFDTMAYLSGYKGRSLLLHSPTDENIPYNSTLHLHPYVTKHIPIDGSHLSPIIPWRDVKAFIDGNDK
jgi:pimeloyl-ACP methyl ester carboxylesterase